MKRLSLHSLLLKGKKKAENNIVVVVMRSRKNLIFIFSNKNNERDVYSSNHVNASIFLWKYLFNSGHKK
jgi:hypothetical protein